MYEYAMDGHQFHTSTVLAEVYDWSFIHDWSITLCLFNLLADTRQIIDDFLLSEYENNLSIIQFQYIPMH